MVEYGVAKLALPGHAESGDHHVVRCNRNGVLIAAIDGIGHGEEAADAARMAASIDHGCICSGKSWRTTGML